ncbi:DUF221-domain-containing protein [Polychaeton citri CBS 116435]|uniref:DUF221-domain-containing protein n=1 Tax=Polychaeton citri CBS 116435 TaxID=1314669 RepID=A0A9P4QGN5_9PEZI|nr:DUF221-domain-containing protein [Polychaeton citri CBS 116435]
MDDDDDFFAFTTEDDYKKLFGVTNTRDTTIQILLSIALGIVAFFAFCILRPRFPGLYAARKKHRDEATVLPELPSTLFGWIRPLWRVTDQQVLASGGLDAYVFLAFFKLAMKFFAVTLFFSLIVIKPVHDAYPDKTPGQDNSTHRDHGKHDKNEDMRRSVNLLASFDANNGTNHNGTTPSYPFLDIEISYLWMYVVFAYLFSGIAIYLIISETRRIIEIRQEYLGTQTTVTDRTFRMSGIPTEFQDEIRLKDFVESLDIGKVESVTLCRDWRRLDAAVNERMEALRCLEQAYTKYIGHMPVDRQNGSLPTVEPANGNPPSPRLIDAGDTEGEDAPLNMANGDSHVKPYASARPNETIRYGWMKLQSRQVDAIDHFEEKLRQATERVNALRKSTFRPTPLAFVTMDSVAACQMAEQAVLDPSPLQLIANPSPAPADVVWQNVYLSRQSRMWRSWFITALIVLLTVFWSVALVPVAGLLNTDTIGQVFPGIAKALDNHKNIQSLVNTQLPTLATSLLMVLVPYLYYWLSSFQGMISAGDVELSAISKNFFFTFFNFFVVFTILGTASGFLQLFEKFGDAINDFRKVGKTLALSLQGLLTFYVNFIILQGVGLFPFRLLEVGAVVLYPVWRLGARTPRDFAELVQPPVFSYGFYLPTSLLVFVIGAVYSVLRSSWQVLLAGLAYFAIGHFVYKYQLLYAMDHSQHSTGRAWVMICDRIIVGLVFFQLTTAGQLILKQAVTRALLIIPLVIATIWFAIAYGKTYKPLMQFIALRSVRRGEGYSDESPTRSLTMSAELAAERNVWAEDGVQWRINRETRFGRAVDASGETGLIKFINPNLVAPLEELWIEDKSVRSQNRVGEA